jgi:hypothetical protein
MSGQDGSRLQRLDEEQDMPLAGVMASVRRPTTVTGNRVVSGVGRDINDDDLLQDNGARPGSSYASFPRRDSIDAARPRGSPEDVRKLLELVDKNKVENFVDSLPLIAALIINDRAVLETEGFNNQEVKFLINQVQDAIRLMDNLSRKRVQPTYAVRNDDEGHDATQGGGSLDIVNALLDAVKVRKYIKDLRRDSNIRSYSYVNSDSLVMNNVQDMATGEQYKRDEYGRLITNTDPSRLLGGPVVSDIGQCYAGLNVECDQPLAMVILSGNKDKLFETLKELRDADPFDIAVEDIKKMHPDMIKNVLKTFGFDVREKDGIKTIQPYDDWFNTVYHNLPKDVKEALVQKNIASKLARYLQALVEILNKNPAILNKNMKTAPPVNDTVTGVKEFKLPVYSGEKEKVNEASLTDAIIANFSNSLVPVNPLIASLASANVVPMAFTGVQMGGAEAAATTGDRLLQIYEMLVQRFSNNGKRLDKDDDAKVRGNINKIKAYEKDTVDLIKLLKDYNDLVDILKTLGGDVKNSPHKMTVSAISKSISEVRDAIKAQMQVQQNAINSLLTVFSNMNIVMKGGSSKMIVPV